MPLDKRTLSLPLVPLSLERLSFFLDNIPIRSLHVSDRSVSQLDFLRELLALVVKSHKTTGRSNVGPDGHDLRPVVDGKLSFSRHERVNHHHLRPALVFGMLPFLPLECFFTQQKQHFQLSSKLNLEKVDASCSSGSWHQEKDYSSPSFLLTSPIWASRYNEFFRRAFSTATTGTTVFPQKKNAKTQRERKNKRKNPQAKQREEWTRLGLERRKEMVLRSFDWQLSAETNHMSLSASSLLHWNTLNDSGRLEHVIWNLSSTVQVLEQ